MAKASAFVRLLQDVTLIKQIPWDAGGSPDGAGRGISVAGRVKLAQEAQKLAQDGF